MFSALDILVQEVRGQVRSYSKNKGNMHQSDNLVFVILSNREKC